MSFSFVDEMIAVLQNHPDERSFSACKALLLEKFPTQEAFVHDFCHLSFAHNFYQAHRQQDILSLEESIEDLAGIYTMETINQTNDIWKRVFEEKTDPPPSEKPKKRRLRFVRKNKSKPEDPPSEDPPSEDPPSEDIIPAEPEAEPPHPESVQNTEPEIEEGFEADLPSEAPEESQENHAPAVVEEDVDLEEYAPEESPEQEEEEISLWDALHGQPSADFQPEKRIFGVYVPQHSMLLIEPGIFRMGNSPHDPYTSFEADPAHHVLISEPFWIAAFPCAQLLYDAVMPKNPSSIRRLYNPVENITWCEAIWFCNALSRAEGLVCAYETPAQLENSTDFARKVYWNRSANGYRLPTEAEWEYAARAGIHERFSGAENVSELKEVAWFQANSRKTTQPVGDKKPNNWGLYDMTGNVYEWVWDTKERPYNSDPCIDPVYEAGDSAKRMFRGGGWNTIVSMSSISYRRWSYADVGADNKGIRLVRGF